MIYFVASIAILCTIGFVIDMNNKDVNPWTRITQICIAVWGLILIILDITKT